MLIAKNSNANAVQNILSKSFIANKSTKYTTKNLQILMRYAWEMGQASGAVFLSKCLHATVITRHSWETTTTWHSLFWDVKLIFGGIGIFNLHKTIKRERLIKCHHPKKFIHIWFVGVLPQSQQQGKGTQILRQVLAFYKDQNLPFILETSNKKIIPTYLALGFKHVATLDLGYELFIYKKTHD